MRSLKATALLASALTLTIAPVRTGAAQQAGTADFRWEKQLAADKVVSLHNLNGDITVTTSTSGKVEITGRRRGRYPEDVTIEVYEWSGGIAVCSIFARRETECDEDGMHDRGRGRRDRDDYYGNARIDMEVRVPKGMRVSAGTVSGDVRMTGAEGIVRVGSVSGDVRLDGVRASAIRVSSVSGNIEVRVEALTGDGSLDFSSVSGDVTVELPRDLNADISLRSVSGELDSDFPLMLNGRLRRSSIDARIGQGGRQMELHTVSGDVRLRRRP